MIPTQIERVDIGGGELGAVYPSPNSLTHRLGGDFWFSADGDRLIVACGTVFAVAEGPAEDLTYSGELAGVGTLAGVYHAPAAGQILAIPGAGGDPADGVSCISAPEAPGEETLLVYSDRDLAPLSRLELPPLDVGGKLLPYKTRAVFANGAGTRYYIVVRLNNRSAQLPDYNVITLIAEAS